MTYFSASYTDFIRFNRKPNEDFYLISSTSPIFTVADGVTQGRFESGAYAFPTGARAAAQIFCYTNVEFLEKNIDFKQKDNLRFNKALIEKSFNLANRRIKELNINEGINKKLNYFDYDWFDAVGVLGFIMGDNLYYGFVGDCGLAIFDKDNQLKFQTKDEVRPFLEKAKKIYIANIATERGETENYSIEDHIQALIKHSHEKIFDICLVNSNIVHADVDADDEGYLISEG